ncbi:tRNA (adenosine(37)-N6)-dimethylallyltransferase MiaA [Epibacterium ulvae]|uniref:tRNA (adenosine(37)-N6)-dimethylallyltransferase MiaA n=1 Tax=Epibacterium ulvae TaxID=1156985 RepID=UPI001BFC03E5|nr:tRNA (adenosine(37)-N6)-dimethylallyltransferase MiaA [Epibacterium ulvae]MBT8156038.1 tRNA (adenosine(37)-N6)-dimethylallyltransferase MiaA [Epibacterium ulvae]
MMLPQTDPDLPVLIAGPTASGKSDLALRFAESQGGVVVNADASQIFNCWRVVTARPSIDEESRAPHALYGHVEFDQPYSAGHWLRDVQALLKTGQRPIIVGGTGLYFQTLTRGMADIPATPPDIRQEADALSLDTLRDGLDPVTTAGIDMQNRMRVQRAWEVQRATGRSLADWQADTPPPTLDLEHCTAIVMHSDKDWLEQRIRQRFDKMVAAGALEEVEAMRDRYDPKLPSCKAIGVPELMDYVTGVIDLDTARERASVATRQFAKRQRTWFRSKMSNWDVFRPDS